MLRTNLSANAFRLGERAGRRHCRGARWGKDAGLGEGQGDQLLDDREDKLSSGGHTELLEKTVQMGVGSVLAKLRRLATSFSANKGVGSVYDTWNPCGS
jgi:hypothetical protein